MPTNILMPALSPTMTEGTLARWLKKEGDEVKAGDVIAEIETDKATMEVEAVDEGVLGRILVGDGTEGVKVNDPIAVLVEPGEAVPEGARAGGGKGAEGRRRRNRPGQRPRAIRLRKRGRGRRRGERRQGRGRGGAARLPAIARRRPARGAAHRRAQAERPRRRGRRARLRLAPRAPHGAAGRARPLARAGQRPERPHREERHRSGAGARTDGATGARRSAPATHRRTSTATGRRAGAETRGVPARRTAQGGAEQHGPQGHRPAFVRSRSRPSRIST